MIITPIDDPITYKAIHSDARGLISCFYVDGIEHTILTTKEGYARGGCVHKINDEYLVVLAGSVEYHMIYPHIDVVKVFLKGQKNIVPAGIPHYLIALQDSVVLEWGATPAEKKVKHKPTRKIVDEINWFMEKC